MRIWRKGEYTRLSVDRDLLQWCGWGKWTKLLGEIGNPLTRDLICAEFSLMGRAREALNARSEMFRVDNEAGYVMVKGLPVEKRWKKLGVELYCKDCGSLNELRATVCVKCGANLLTMGRKKFLTEKVDMMRVPFWFPLKEPQVEFLLDRVQGHDGFLFPELQSRPRNGRGEAYNLIREVDSVVQKYLDVPHGWNHLFVALRGHCLGEEYDMDELEIKNFSSRVKSETVSKYVKKRLSYARKMGFNAT